MKSIPLRFVILLSSVCCYWTITYMYGHPPCGFLIVTKHCDRHNYKLLHLWRISLHNFWKFFFKHPFHFFGKKGISSHFVICLFSILRKEATIEFPVLLFHLLTTAIDSPSAIICFRSCFKSGNRSSNFLMSLLSLDLLVMILNILNSGATNYSIASTFLLSYTLVKNSSTTTLLISSMYSSSLWLEVISAFTN